MTLTAVTTQAFLTKTTGHIMNQFVPGTVKTELTEPGWDPTKKQSAFPGQYVTKDPTVENVGSLDEWVFLKVQVPMETIAAVDSVSKRKTEKKKMELVLFEADPNWILLDVTEHEKMKEYVYGYKTKLSPGEKTKSLFQGITVVNYLEGELPANYTAEIPVKAMSIQSNGVEENQDPKGIYEIYLKQEAADAR